MRITAHHTVAELRTFIRKERRGKIARRLQAILKAREGLPSEEIAPLVQMSERTVRHWVACYNKQQLAGLEDRPGRGRKKALTSEQEEQLKARVRAGATDADGVCTLRGEDLRQILKTEFNVVRGLQATYNLLHALGFSVLQPRPKHPQADPEAQKAFKKKPPSSSPTSRPNTPTKSSRSGSKTSAALGKKAR
jgi:transposase